MSSKTTLKQGVQPKLRFPEFRDAGDWEVKRLGDLGKLISGLTYSPNDIRESGLLVLRSSNIQDGRISLQDNVYVTNDIRGANLSKPNDILICVRNGSKSLIGKNALIPDVMPLCTHGAFMSVFRTAAWMFIFQLFQSPLYQEQVDGDLGATINSINGKQFLNYRFAVPSTTEQQRIADCLTSLDDLITAQSDKLDELRKYKQGLMQRLFPVGGETVPQVRFQEFRRAREWEEMPLRNVLTLVVREVAKPSSAYLGIGLRSHGKGIFLKPDQDPEKNSMDKLYLVYRNDLIVNITFAWEGAIAIAGDAANGGYVSHRFPTYVFKDLISMPAFFRYVIVGQAFVHKLGIISPGGAGRNRVLNKSDFLDITVSLPSIPEQQRIANCLSSLDDLITAQSEKLDALREHKRGLMQQLFPAIDEAEA